jgi:linoleoyl-CoA desaturase
MLRGMTEPASLVRFSPRGAFSRDLEESAQAYFDGLGRGRRDVPRMYVKTAIILLWFVGSWALLVFGARNAWEGALCAVSLGLSIAGVGMSVQHDANHGAYSNNSSVNRIFGSTLDVMGVCSFIWRLKHNIAHHTFTNVQGVDFDLDFGLLARLSPEQPHRRWHGYQQFYLWFFYGFLLPKWVFFDDFVILRHRLIGIHKLPKPGRAALAGFVFWKLFFLAWAVVIPSFFHPLWHVLIFHFVAAFTLGATLGTVFQLAHCTSDAEYPEVPAGRRMDNEWAAHQLATCVNFAPRNELITWFVGGLNFQVEHHLFPKVCHLHYPALSLVVAEVAERHGLRHRSHATITSALMAHFKHLRCMGQDLPSSSLA